VTSDELERRSTELSQSPIIVANVAGRDASGRR
jgi:hypothetical protein